MRVSYGASTSAAGIQPGSPGTWFMQLTAGPSERKRDPSATPRATPDGYHTRKVWPIRFRSPLRSRISFPAGTEMFYFLRTPCTRRHRPMTGERGFPLSEILGSKPRWRLSRGIMQPQTSFIGPVCQGIHHTPLQATRTTRCAWPQGSFLANSQTTNHHTKMITKRSKQTLKNRVRFEINSKNEEPKGNPVLLASTIQFSSHHAPPRRPDGTSPPSGTMGIESRQAKAWGGDPGAQKRIRTTPAEHPTTDEPKAHDLFHTSSPRPPRLPRRRGSHRRTNIRLHSP